MTYDLPLPQSIKDMAVESPIEDIIIYAIREHLPDLPFGASIPAATPDFFGIVRAANPLGSNIGDARFVQWSDFDIEVFARGATGDEACAVISEAIRVALFKSWYPKPLIVPGRGHIVRVDQTIKPANKSDWATSNGPVQYASLPTDFWRYESSYVAKIRVYPKNPFLQDL